MNFFEKLHNRICYKKTYLCIGLDPTWEKIPKHIQRTQDGLLEFLCQIIDKTINHAAVFKLNFAFFESLGILGIEVLQELILKIPQEIPVIGDAKRGDIGNSSEMYARAIFEKLKCDAITVNPYQGGDALRPFFEYVDRGVFVLCLTSNPGAAEFQLPNLYLKVAKKVVEWNVSGNAGLVIGGTRPEYISKLRKQCRGMPFLIPGIGEQGGDLEKTIISAEDDSNVPYIINVSRNILYASSKEDYAEQAGEVAKNISAKINLCRLS